MIEYISSNQGGGNTARRPIPVVISSYNRPNSLRRILSSLLHAHYCHDAVPLLISLDAGGPNGTREIAEAFEWPFGPKTVVARDRQLGMRDHAFACMELLTDVDNIIFLEDDSWVGHNFYNFAVAAAECIDQSENVFAASLYAFDFCEFDGLRFAPVPTSEDLYLMKSATTWGVLFARSKWFNFREWHNQNQNLNTGAEYVPDSVNNWPKTSWKKFLNRYLSTNGMYFAYPYVSHLTHFADPGTHFSLASGNFQVPTMRNLSLKPFALRCDVGDMVSYDEFWELEPPMELVNHFGCEFECDLRRLKAPHQIRKAYVITSRAEVGYTRDFSGLLFPLESNCWTRIDGDILHLVDLSAGHILPLTKRSPKPDEVRYYMKDIGLKREFMLLFNRFQTKVLQKIPLRKIFS